MTAWSLCDLGHVPQFPHGGEGQDETLPQSATVRVKPDCVKVTHWNLGLEERRLVRGQVTETAWPRGWLVLARKRKISDWPHCAQAGVWGK